MIDTFVLITSPFGLIDLRVISLFYSILILVVLLIYIPIKVIYQLAKDKGLI